MTGSKQSFFLLLLMQMDICSRIGFSPNDINRLHGIRLDTLGSTYGDISVDELAYGATKFLNIQDDDDDQKGVFQMKNEFGDQKGVFQMKNEFGDQKGVFQMKNECGEGNESEIMTAESFSKCGIFPCSRKTLSSVGGEGACKGKMKDDVNRKVLTHDDDDDANLPCSSAPSLPELVSAMKGSREKGGKKLNMKWAPDVYDPVPTSVGVSSSRNKHKNSKKKSKKKGSSRESKGKEKKQSRKRGSSLNYYYNSEHKEEVTFVSEIDFHLDLDLFCGSSFANPYGSNLHLSSIAEAI